LTNLWITNNGFFGFCIIKNETLQVFTWLLEDKPEGGQNLPQEIVLIL